MGTSLQSPVVSRFCSNDTAHHYTDSDVGVLMLVSLHIHYGNMCVVGFIWLLSLNNGRKRLK
jgi:hypothetical protein